MTKYYECTLDDGLSGDDINRRRREAALGNPPPSKDWEDCNKEIRCIYPGQVVTRPAISTAGIFFYYEPAVFASKRPHGFILGHIYDDDGRGIEETYPNFVPQMSINPDVWKR